MVVTIKKFAAKGCMASLFFAAAMLSAQQHKAFDGTWQMDSAASHVNDGRLVTLMIATSDNAIKVTLKTRKKDGQEVISEFSGQFGNACEFVEGSHKSQVTFWYDGPALNVSKENGPPDDVTSLWKFELSPDKQKMTMTISHYEPSAGDETLVFNKAVS